MQMGQEFSKKISKEILTALVFFFFYYYNFLFVSSSPITQYATFIQCISKLYRRTFFFFFFVYYLEDECLEINTLMQKTLSMPLGK